MRWHRWSTCRVAMKKKHTWWLAGVQKGILALHKTRAAWMHVYSPLLEAHTMVSRQPSAGCRRDTQSLRVVAEQWACVYILAAAQAASAQRVGWHSMIRLQWIPVSIYHSCKNSHGQKEPRWWLLEEEQTFIHLAVFLSVAAIQIIARPTTGNIPFSAEARDAKKARIRLQSINSSVPDMLIEHTWGGAKAPRWLRWFTKIIIYFSKYTCLVSIHSLSSKKKSSDRTAREILNVWIY